MEKFQAAKEDRLDVLLAEAGKMTRSQAQKIIEKGVKVGEKDVTKAGYRVKAGTTVFYEPLVTAPVTFQAEEMPLDIIYEDEDILIVNKPRGLVVHPAAGHPDGTLANGLAFLMKGNEEEEDEDFRMGLVHRIDKDTSGLLAVAKNEKAKEALSADLAIHAIQREYLALASGYFKDKLFKVEAPIGRDSFDRKRMAIDVRHGKPAVTHFEVLRQYKGSALLKCRLETGRTHQIRVHLAYLNHPIIGDELYSSLKTPGADQGQVLHAFKLVLKHPSTGKLMTFYAVSDQYFKDQVKEACLKE
jgi:23S rRNA pseudouridine1911/1915/1917 synthase